MSFDARLAMGRELEARVVEALRVRGWSAEPFGQSLLSSQIRNGMRQVVPPVSVRWMPDIIATKPRDYERRMLLVFIDAKAGITYQRTGNYDIEIAALETAERWTMFALGSWFFFVFDDLRVLSPSVVRTHGRPGPYRGQGSGTAFLLVRATHALPFDDIFGLPVLDSPNPARPIERGDP